ncbi:MAG: nuclear transport factor 2 family protein [Candidatus Eisenbacteria bacterium]|nr:nuclear transport factor 2 family protein [Candidatus Eisenbacteria bacterium]
MRSPSPLALVAALVAALAAALVAAPLALAADPPDTTSSRADFDALVAAERAFAALSVEKGMKTAFLQYLAGDAIVFNPGPTNGRALWESREDNPQSVLAWEPAFAEVSGAGDLGWTTGPWQFAGRRAQEPTAFGHFVSVWRRQGDGSWRVAVDLGVGHDKPERGVGSRDFTPGPAHPRPRALPRSGFGVGVGYGGARSGFGVGVHTGAPYPREVEYATAHQLNSLLATDRSYGFDLANRGAAEACRSLVADDVRFCRDGAQPAMGHDATIAWHDRKTATIDRKHGGKADWMQRGQGVATSTDLGYVYGLVARRENDAARPDTSTYLHIWRKDQRDKWRLALDLESGFSKRK